MGLVEGRIDGTGGLQLRTLAWHAPDSRAGALIVHGLGEHGGRYDHVARALNDAGVSAFAWDHRGHGGSQGRRGHADRFELLLQDADRAAEWASSQLGATPRFVVGHSMGGLIGLAWVQSRQPRLSGLVASAPWLATARPLPAVARRIARVLSRILPTVPISSGNDPRVLTSDPEMQEDWRQDPLVHGRITPRLFAEAEATQARVLGAADQLKCDALFLVPGEDRLADASVTRAFTAELPPERTSVLELPGFRHEAFNERGRDQVIGEVRQWIARRL